MMRNKRACETGLVCNTILFHKEMWTFVCQTSNLTQFDLEGVPGAAQALEELDGNGASQRMFRKFIESS